MIFNYDVSNVYDSLHNSDFISNLVLGTGTSIPANSNLNNYTTPATYRCSTSATAETLLNCPISTVNFKLLVLAGGSSNYDNYVVQIIVAPRAESNIDSVLYIRTLNSGTWSDWYTLITSGNVVSVSQGGTGLTSSPSMLVNLASTSSANVLTSSPRPGITGTLPVDHGGTGATSADNARSNLDLGNLKANFYTNVTAGSSTALNVPNSARGILVGISVSAAQHFAYTVATTSAGVVRTGALLEPASDVTITTTTNKITVANSGSYGLFVYWFSLSGDDIS